jgi:alkylated DNA repair dioxygenase AlkB
MLFQDPIHFNLKDAELIYYPNFFNLVESNHLFKLLLNKTEWQEDDITVFGKTYKQPRLTALYANNNKPYSYSNITMKPSRFYKELDEIKTRVEKRTEAHFTTCLLNLYRDGNDSNGWHADNEKELGTNPIIASVSFGATRKFHLKHNADKSLKQTILLEHGSLLLMKGTTQHCWKHQIPKTKKIVEKRINLTFRYIK